MLIRSRAGTIAEVADGYAPPAGWRIIPATGRVPASKPANTTRKRKHGKPDTGGGVKSERH